MKVNVQLYVELLEAEIARLRVRVDGLQRLDAKREIDRPIGRGVQGMLGVTAAEAADQLDDGFTPPRNLVGEGHDAG